MDSEKAYRIFGEDSAGGNAIRKLLQTPYGKSVLSAQIQKDLRRRLGIEEGGISKDITAQVRYIQATEEEYKVHPEMRGKDVYFIWSDGDFSSKTAKEVEDKVDEIEAEITKMGYEPYFYVTYVPKTGANPNED